ncbi:MAG: NAD-dependent epimerase/dehydratase family protein [Bacteroidetes bacterium]|nr:NAD-dependent epimerase/dehydratase family protein [Bacteroidota bacterium]
MNKKSLVIGAGGQVGSELVDELRRLYGGSQVVASDIKPSTNKELAESGPFEVLDVLDRDSLLRIVKKHHVGTVYNLAALLSATAEKNPEFGWKLNMEGHFNVLDLAREGHISRIFWPSSIAVFGPGTPKVGTPQDCVMDPSTVYGISKLAGERWSAYYHQRWGVDVRSVRYPGLISYKTLPGGGTTDYAVDIFYKAISQRKYTCFLKADTNLPMLYMPDAIKATIDITEAPSQDIKIRSSYNLAGFSFTPNELAQLIAKRVSGFEISYDIDFRQQIAESWPGSIDDSEARKHWGWNNSYSINDMVDDMLTNLSKQ